MQTEFLWRRHFRDNMEHPEEDERLILRWILGNTS